MGMNVGGDKHGPKSDINMTPLVDVVLVLLIIFMVTMPIMMRHITLEVPRKVEDESKVVVASKPITVTVRQDGAVIINDGNKDLQITRVELASKLRPMIENKSGEKTVFVDFDDAVMYNEAVSTMDTIKGAGAEKVALKIRDKDPPQ